MKRLMKLPDSTPYWGLPIEIGSWTTRMKVR